MKILFFKLKEIKNAIAKKKYIDGYKILLDLTESYKGWEKYLDTSEVKSLFSTIDKLFDYDRSFAKIQIENAQKDLGYPIDILDDGYYFYIEHMPIEDVQKIVDKLNTNPIHANGYDILFKPSPQDMGNTKICIYVCDLKSQCQYIRDLAKL